MKRNYRASTLKPRVNRRRIILAWIVIATAIIFPLVMFYFKYKSHHTIQQTSTTPATTQQVAPKFDFYTILPATKVASPAEAQQSSDGEILPHSEMYVLQISSLKAEKDAKMLRDRLLELGYRALIQPYRTQQTLWYRVLVGPYMDLSAAEQAQRALHRVKYDSLLLKLSKSTEKTTQVTPAPTPTVVLSPNKLA